jgi:hypothetical protein
MNVEADAIRPLTQDTLFAMARRAGLRTGVAGFYWFGRFLPPATSLDEYAETMGEDRAADEAITAPAVKWIQRGDVELILIHLDQVDWAGHNLGGPRGPEWKLAAARVDETIGTIAKLLDPSRDVLVVGSDHGQIDAGGHGGPDKVCRETPFVLAGPGLIPGAHPEIRQVDVAPTLAVLLGLGVPASAQGKAAAAMLSLGPKGADSLVRAEAAQKAALAKYLREVKYREMAIRPWVGPLLAALGWFVFLAAITLLPLRRNKGASTLSMAFIGLAQAVLFHLLYRFALGLPYSISWVRSSGDFILRAAGLGAACALAASLLAALLAAKKGAGAGAAARSASAQALFSALFSALPLVLYVGAEGFAMTAPLPQFGFWFAGMCAGVQLIGIGAAGILGAPVGAIFGKVFKAKTAA